MKTLHHHPLYAASRTARLVLAERGLMFMPKLESPWERHDEFLVLNPAGEVPVLVTEDGIVLAGSLVIAEFNSLQDAQTWADADPYVAAGVYAKVVVKPFKKVLPSA